MVRPERAFDPDQDRHSLYAEWYELYRHLWPTMAGYLRTLASMQASSSP
jgi:hypothetical protein